MTLCSLSYLNFKHNLQDQFYPSISFPFNVFFLYKVKNFKFSIENKKEIKHGALLHRKVMNKKIRMKKRFNKMNRLFRHK